MNGKIYDVIILGAGPAGLTAAIYTTRYGLSTLVISKEVGGMANYAHQIENYPGYNGSGSKLMKKFFSQAQEHGAEFMYDDLISIHKDKNEFLVVTPSGKVFSRSVIIALGTQRRKLNVRGEDKFLGKGVSYCAVCDGNFFRGKDVAVVGGGESACKAAIMLSRICRKVYFICKNEKEKCSVAEIKNLRQRNNIEYLYNSVPIEICGKEIVSSLRIEEKGKKKNIKLSGVFIEIGGLPVSDIAGLLGIKMDEEGYIHADREEMTTNVSGVFAAGDVIRSRLKQVVIAAAQGAKAAKSAYDYLSEK